MPQMDNESLLIKEYEEINQYVRSTCQLAMAWYTFFITGNLIASGWLVAGGTKENPTPLFYVILVATLFIIINGLSVRGFGKLIPYLKQSDDRLKVILTGLRNSTSDEVPVLSPCPNSPYIQLLRLYQISLYTVGVFWVGLLILKISRSA